MHLYGYTIGDHVSSSQHGDVYLAVRESDGREVVLKCCPRLPDVVSAARREFGLLKRIDSEHVPEPLAVEERDGSDVLVLARLPGVDLAHFADKRVLEPRTFLTLAAQCAQVLTDLHEARIVHKDIKPRNLMVDPETLDVRLIDFGISAELGEVRRGRRADVVEGTLGYISPEQTGRLDTGIDFRSDLYSLGATFYELLTGRPAFEATSPEGFFYAHVAQIPTPPSELNADVPVTLSRIVMRLLEKDPESRYQTARGLRFDLVECSKQLVRAGRIDPEMALGTQDVPDRLRFPRRLYGRESETATLLAAYARARRAQRAVVLVSGPVGVGKTALTDVVRVALAEDAGHMARARFDRYRSDRAYAGLADALESLIDQLLTQPREGIDRWAGQIREALGDLAGTLGGVLPGLSLLLGDLPETPLFSASEVRARLAAAVGKMLHVLARSDHPLVLVLDDLHWADPGSRMLVEELLSDTSPAALLLVIVYRDTLFDGSHRLLEALEPLERTEGGLTRISLAPISDEDTVQFLADVLDRDPEDVVWLARRASLRTGNCPGMLRDLLIQLQEQGALHAAASGGWEWNREAVDAVSMSDHAVSFASAKIARLPAQARELLNAAACIGEVFEPEFATKVVGGDRRVSFQNLVALSDECLIAPCREGFRFVHDRLREAALEQVSAEERTRLHGAIGRELLSAASPAKRKKQAMLLCDHLNRADPPANESERGSRLELNLIAAGQSLAAAASSGADVYLAAGRALFVRDDWKNHPRLAFDLHFGRVRSAVLAGLPEEAERHLGSLESLPLPLLDWARVVAERIEIRTAMQGPRSGVETGLRALAQLGAPAPASPSWFRTRLEVARTRWLTRRPERLAGTDTLETDPRLLAETLIVRAIGHAAFRENIHLLLVLVCRVIRSQVRTMSQVHAMSLAAFAHLQAAVTGDYRTAVRLGEAALARNLDRSPVLRVQVVQNVYLMIHSWTRPRRPVIDRLDDVAREAFELGARELGLYSRLWRAFLLLTVGEPLSLVERELRAQLPQAHRISPSGWAVRMGVLSKLQMLSGHPDARTTDSGGLASAHPGEIPSDAATLLATSRQHANLTSTVALMSLYVLGNYEEAFERGRGLSHSIVRAGGTAPHVSEFFLYQGLAAAALIPRASGASRREARRVLQRSVRRMRRFARIGPDNFQHQALLLLAERARAQNRPGRAVTLYEHAAREAENRNFPHHLAITRERLADLLVDAGQKERAAALVRQAISGYSAWGAHAKVERLS